MRLGIDFGTTRTVVAAAEQGRYPVAAFETDGGFSEYLPGLAVCTPDLLCFGFEASQALASASAVVRSIKRSTTLVPHTEPVPELAGFAISSLDLVTRYARFVRRMLFECSNLDLDADERLEAMVAVPANSGSRQRYLVLEAFRRAGFDVIGMVNEPTAAAIEFSRRHLGMLSRRSPKKYVAVYDLGGGTFDSAAVSLEERRFELMASEGIGQLGGDDFDEIILELAQEQLGRGFDDLGPGARVRALTICQQAKESLTAASRRVLLDLTEVWRDTEPVILDTATIYDRCQPLIDRSVEKLDQVFAGLTARGIDVDNPRELGAIYLVGGAAAFPAVMRTLKRRYGRKIQLAPQPHAATALGLAIAADPAAEIYVREAMSRHFGVWRDAWGGSDQWFDRLVCKDNAPHDDGPLVVERWYRPQHAVGRLRFLECSEISGEGAPAGDVTPVGEIVFPYDPQLKDVAELEQLPQRRLGSDGDEIVERYTYHHDGSIALDIQNRTHGYQRNFVLGQLH